jgi:hypothetical protein
MQYEVSVYLPEVAEESKNEWTDRQTVSSSPSFFSLSFSLSPSSFSLSSK